MTADERIAKAAALAADWRDPDFPPREAAVRATLAAGGRYTEEGLAFALNHRMHQLTADALRRWLGAGEGPAEPLAVRVSAFGGAPLGGLEEGLAAWLLGHGAAPDDTVAPVVRAFLGAHGPLLENPDAWTAEVPADEIEERRAAAGVPPERVLFRPLGTAAAVLGGRERDEAWSGLAEDLLLHDGQSERTPRVVWAPEGTAPDPLLNAMAAFREYVPAHPDTDGTLSLPAAFLAAADTPRAIGPGFLVSLGAPEPQAPGHTRWAEYADLADVRRWLEAEAASFVVAEPDVAERLRPPVPVVAPGDAHRPPLDPRVPAFLRAL